MIIISEGFVAWEKSCFEFEFNVWVIKFKNIYYKIKRNLDKLDIEDIQKYFKKLFNWNSFVGE